MLVTEIVLDRIGPRKLKLHVISAEAETFGNR